VVINYVKEAVISVITGVFMRYRSVSGYCHRRAGVKAAVPLLQQSVWWWMKKG